MDKGRRVAVISQGVAMGCNPFTSSRRASRATMRPAEGRRPLAHLLPLAICSTACTSASAQQASDAELATKLSNPVASLISVPLQLNWDREIGPDHSGHKLTLNVQPVIPAELSDDWTLISRIIVPIVDQHNPSLGDGSQRGIGDVTGEFFFVPAALNQHGRIFGFGPAMLIPTNTDFISADKWALGPAVVIAQQDSGWTYGALIDHLWSVAGGGPQDISNTFVQPLVSYTTKEAWTFGLNAEATYDWKGSQWTVPLNATVSKLVRFGKQPVSLGVTARYYVESPSTGPHGWGARLTATFLFPH